MSDVFELSPVTEVQPSAALAMVENRAAQEVQAAMVIAKKFPRDEADSYNRIMRACSRKTLAESAMYSFPRGGTTVTGPTIRLAEELARCWGNIDSGVIELSQKEGESEVMAYAWDLETNRRSCRVFTVKHERRVGKGDQARIDKLYDPRDIYEMVSNQGSRHLRSCILRVIPGDIVEAAVNQCDKTLSQGGTEPIADRIRKMVAAFSEMGVTKQAIELKLGHSSDAITEVELVHLRKAYVSIKDGAVDAHEVFPPPATPQVGRSSIGKKKEEQEESK